MAGENLFKKLRGILGSIFQIDQVNDGPNLKHDGSGNLQIRNAADTGFVTTSGAPATAPSHYITKAQLDSTSRPVIVTGQFDGNDPLPASSSLQYLVVTTSGGTASIGDLIFDDGNGNVAVLAAQNGRVIATTVGLTGGTISFDADSQYLFDQDGSSGSANTWVKTGDIGSVTNAVKTIRFSAATVDADSTNQIPAGAIVLKAEVKVTTNYSAGATGQVVDALTGTTDTLAAVADMDLVSGPVPRTYQICQDTVWTANSAVRMDIAGTPAAGASVVTVSYSEPLG